MEHWHLLYSRNSGDELGLWLQVYTWSLIQFPEEPEHVWGWAAGLEEQALLGWNQGTRMKWGRDKDL